MEVREARKEVARSEPEEQEDEDQALDEAYVAEAFKKYQPVSFGRSTEPIVPTNP